MPENADEQPGPDGVLPAMTAGLPEKQAEIDALRTKQAAIFASTSSGRSLRSLPGFMRAKLRPLLNHTPARWLAPLRKPVLWTFNQHPARPLRLPRAVPTPANPPSIAMVTPAYNHAHFLAATIDSILSQNYPRLAYIVKDAGSKDGTREVLAGYGSRLHWLAEPDTGQANAINTGFRHVSGDIMGWLNSDDLLLPGSLNYVASFFNAHPEIDFVYGDRVIIDREGAEIGRAILPAHDASALRHADYVPQETMFWRRRVWEALGGLDESFQFAMDWDFILRAQAQGFRFQHLPRCLGAFRVYPQQKTHSWVDVGAQDQQRLREKWIGPTFTVNDVKAAIKPYLIRQTLCHYAYKIGVLRR
jgi:hypothetical protein